MEFLNRVRKEKWLVTTIHLYVHKSKPFNNGAHTHKANNSFCNTTVNGWLVNSRFAFRISLMYFWLPRTTLENHDSIRPEVRKRLLPLFRCTPFSFSGLYLQEIVAFNYQDVPLSTYKSISGLNCQCRANKHNWLAYLTHQHCSLKEQFNQ